jgi:predicted nucleotidyltransferase
MDAALRFFDILKILDQHGVEFILVGGVAAILEGAPVSTFDLDVMVRPTPEDRDRLLEALRELNAHYLDPAGRQIFPDRAKLDTLRIHRLVTDSGPMDVLEQIGKGLTYADLTEKTEIYEVNGLPVRTLRLEMIIRSKEEANRDKDQATLPILRRTLLLKKGGGG